MNKFRVSKVTSFFLLILLIPLMSGCSQKEIDLDIGQVALEISESDLFGEDFFVVESNIIAQKYGIESDDIDIVGYASSGGLADELTLIDAKNDESAKDIYELATEHISDNIEGYQSYKPDEVYKLEHAIVLREGKYVIVGVSSSYDDLETSIKSYLK
jgi:hypothetical protein